MTTAPLDVTQFCPRCRIAMSVYDPSDSRIPYKAICPRCNYIEPNENYDPKAARASKDSTRA